MKIFLTGATGCIGRNVLDQLLLNDEYEVTVGVRVTSDITDLYGLNSAIDTLNYYEYEQVQEALGGFDAVIHVAGNVSHQNDDGMAQYHDNVDVTYNIARACVSNNIKKLIITSTAAVHKYHKYDYLQCLDIENNYVKTKRMAELEALRVTSGSKTKLIILRPIIVLGKYDRNNYSTIFRAIANNKIFSNWVLPGTVDFCDADEVAKAHVTALDYNGSHTFFTLKGVPESWAYLNYYIYYEFNGNSRDVYKVRVIPKWLLKPVAIISEIVSKFTGKPADLTRQLIMLMAADNTEYNIGGDPNTCLGYNRDKVRLSTMIEKQLKWLAAENELIRDN